MNPALSKLLSMTNRDAQAGELWAVLSEPGTPDGLQTALAELLPVPSPGLREAVLQGYVSRFPAEAIGVLVEQLGRVTHAGVLESIAKRVMESPEGLRAAGAEPLVAALSKVRDGLSDERVRYLYTEAMAAVSEAEAGDAWFAEVMQGGGRFAASAARTLHSRGRTDLALLHLDALAEALGSGQDMERGVALEVIAELGPHARPLLPSLQALARRLPGAYGLEKALLAVGGGPEVDGESAPIPLDRVRALAGGTPGGTAWAELVHALRGAPEGDDAAVIEELEGLLAHWPNAAREVLEADLVSADRWAPLFRSLTVANGDWTAIEVAAFVDAAVYPGLVELRFEGTRIGDEGIARLVAAPWAAQLSALRLAETGASAAAAGALAEAPLGALKVLDLRFNAIGDEGAERLSRSSTLRLERLRMEGCGLSPEGAARLRRSPAVASLDTGDDFDDPI